MAHETTTAERVRQPELVDGESQQLSRTSAPAHDDAPTQRLSGRTASAERVATIAAPAFMETSDSLVHLLPALVAATKAFTDVDFDRIARVKPRDTNKREYAYQFASLKAVMKAVRGPLAEQGLILMHAAKSLSSGNRTALLVRTTLWHVSGEYIRTDLPVSIFGDDPQNIGTGFSYAKRYNALGLLNLSPGDDDDDDGEGNRLAAEEQQQAPMPPPQPAQRRSQQQTAPATGKPARDSAGNPVKTPEETRQTGAPAPAQDKSPIGVIVDVVERGAGAWVVALNTGFAAGTREEAVAVTARDLKDKKTRVELIYEAPRDPKYAMKLKVIKEL